MKPKGNFMKRSIIFIHFSQTNEEKKKTQITNIRSEREREREIIIDPTRINRITKEYYEQL